MTREEVALQIHKNLEEYGGIPEKIMSTGKRCEFQNRAIEIYEHEGLETITMRFFTDNKITGMLCMSREAAFHSMILINDSMQAYYESKPNV